MTIIGWVASIVLVVLGVAFLGGLFVIGMAMDSIDADVRRMLRINRNERQ